MACAADNNYAVEHKYWSAKAPERQFVINLIATHKNAHQDERYAIFYARKFGEPVLPGVSDARMTFWLDTPDEFAKFDGDRLEAEKGVLPIGLLKGSLDEHRASGERKVDAQGRKECAATLTVQRIGRKLTRLEMRFLEYVRANDINVRGGAFELPQLIKAMNGAYTNDHLVQEWAEKCFGAIHNYGISFYAEFTNGGVRPEAGRRLERFLMVWLLIAFAGQRFPEIVKNPEDYILSGIPDDVFLRFKISLDDAHREPMAAIIRALRLEKEVALENFLSFAGKRVGKTCGNIYEIHNLIDILWATGVSLSEVWKWASAAFDAIWKRGLTFVQESGDDLAKARVVSLFMASNKFDGLQRLPCVVGLSDAQSFVTRARSYEHGRNASVVIQGKSTGNVIIQTDKMKLIRGLDDVVRILRVEEQKAHGIRAIPSDPAVLGKPGDMEGCPEWHYFENGSAIFNGSLTHAAPPTRIPFERVAELVQIGLQPMKFEPTRERHCRQGLCTSIRRSPCPWYDWKLQRCQDIQAKMASGKEARHQSRSSK